MNTVAPQSIAEARRCVREKPYVVLYLSRRGCGVCSAVRPKVMEILASLPEALFCPLDLDLIPEAAGEYGVFTIPAILVYVDGRETIREARHLSIGDLRSRMERLHELRFSSE